VDAFVATDMLEELIEELLISFTESEDINLACDRNLTSRSQLNTVEISPLPPILDHRDHGPAYAIFRCEDFGIFSCVEALTNRVQITLIEFLMSSWHTVPPVC
jgi:hypothetical protein